MALFPFSSVFSLGVALRGALEEDEELRRLYLSSPLALGMAGKDLTVVEDLLLSLLALVTALDRAGTLLVIIALPSRD